MSDFNPLGNLDHLMEFGVSMAVAQQMINTMNHCIDNMKVPGVSLPQQQNAVSKKYHIVANNSVLGPFCLSEMEVLVKAKTITPETLIWMPGMVGWAKASIIPEINIILMLNS